MRSFSKYRGSVSGLIIPVIIILLSTMLYGHGEKKHSDTTAAESTVADSMTVNFDSLNAIIAGGFDELEPVFKRACYDCHSDKTIFPWYHGLPGIKQMIDDDIKDAQKHLDMSNGYPFGGHAGQAENLRAIKKEIEEGEMPPLMYRLMHWSAAPSDEETEAIINWTDKSVKMLSPDSSDVLPDDDD